MDSAPESEFRERVRLFLVEHCMRRVESRDTPMLDDRTTAMTFQRRLFDAGLAGLTVPSEYGGQGLTRRHQEIFNEEAVDFYLPIGLYTITIGMCIPVLLEHGLAVVVVPPDGDDDPAVGAGLVTVLTLLEARTGLGRRRPACRPGRRGGVVGRAIAPDEADHSPEGEREGE